jgi:hypothetical protein
VIKNNRSVLDMLYGNYTFVNPDLAKHYGMNDIPEFQPAGTKPESKRWPAEPAGPAHAFADPSISADTWVRVDDAGRYDRGGLLPMAVFLTQSSPGLRTSVVKRGVWVVRRLLGEVIPPPPATVPELPQDEAKTDAPLRDVLAQHRSSAVCAACHARFDNFGLALEGYGPVGEKREKDLAGRLVDASATFPGGYEGVGLRGLQTYIREKRQNDYLDNLSRKLLSYALGRTLLLSDEPVIERMKGRMPPNGYRFDALVETIVSSPQFLNKRKNETTQNKGSTESTAKRGE